MGGIIAGEVNEGDDAGGDHAEDVSDEGDDAEDAKEEADDEGVGELEDHEGDADEEAVDEGDEDLAAEEGDEVGVDLGEGVDDFVFEFGGFEGDVFVPVLFDGCALAEEVEEVDGDHGEADGVAKDAEDFSGSSQPTKDGGGDLRGVGVEKVAEFLLRKRGVFDGL